MTAAEAFAERDFIREEIDNTTFIYYKRIKKNARSAKLIIRFEDNKATATIETAPYNGVVHRYPAMLDSDTIYLISHQLHEMENPT